ncbi:MAG TPA: ABC transporter permease [Actinomycetota bacterium]|nr:ABC transporter permease [Actinomycetota bacterium]
MATVTAPETATARGPVPGRSAAQASKSAFVALLYRDLAVLKKNLNEFIPRTIIQPFLLVFVFLYVFPKIGQGVGSGSPAGESAFATILIAGVVGLAILFQGIQAVALPMVQEFGYTKEIEDRILAPLPVAGVAIGKVVAGAIQGLIAAAVVFPIAAYVHASNIQPHLTVHWAILLTMIPVCCVCTAALGLTIGTRFDPRQVPSLFAIIIIPMVFLGGTYYAWTALAPVKLGAWAWLQTVVLINPLVYITEGFRAALTTESHMHLYVIYPVLIGLSLLFLRLGIGGFKKRVLS